MGEVFPRFRANANDHVNPQAVDASARARMKLLEAFTPSQPVGDRKRFAGRTEILTHLIRAIEEQRLHTVLYGSRGLGKTSVLHVLAQAARDARYLVVYVSCGSDSNFDEVFRTVAASIPMLFHSTVGPTSEEVEKGQTLADILPETPISARIASDFLAKIVGTRVVIVLDEFDRSESALFRRDVAELIKNLSDRLVRVQLVIAGVAANLVELIEHTPSIQRNIYALQVPWMTVSEIRLLIKNGEELGGVRFDENATRAIVVAAHGSPYIASLISLNAGLYALEEGRSNVTGENAASAIKMAVREFKARLSNRCQGLLWKTVREGQTRALGCPGRHRFVGRRQLSQGRHTHRNGQFRYHPPLRGIDRAAGRQRSSDRNAVGRFGYLSLCGRQHRALSVAAEYPYGRRKGGGRGVRSRSGAERSCRADRPQLAAFHDLREYHAAYRQ